MSAAIQAASNKSISTPTTETNSNALSLEELRQRLKPHCGIRYFRNQSGVLKLVVDTQHRQLVTEMGLDTHPLLLLIKFETIEPVRLDLG